MRVPSLPRAGVRYLEIARAIIRRVPVERGIYLDRRPVREAMGTAYLAVLQAINETLIRRGVARNELPRSVDAHRDALQRHLTRNGKLRREFESLYDLLRLAGYTDGSIYNRRVVREALDAAQRFIERVA